jgi:solute carrier family 45, member 1/2/4
LCESLETSHALFINFFFFCDATSGNLDIPSIIPFLGETQLEGLTVIVSLLLLCCHLITAFMVREKVLLKPDSRQTGYATRVFIYRFILTSLRRSKRTFFGELKDMFNYMLILPKRIKQIVSAYYFVCGGIVLMLHS